LIDFIARMITLRCKKKKKKKKKINFPILKYLKNNKKYELKLKYKKIFKL
jgi:hypothetical protein